MKPVRNSPSTFTQAFTLVELLVVIVIIAMLSALIVPASERVMHSARASHCLGNLRNLGAALQLYLGDHNNLLPELVMLRESKDEEKPAIDTVLNEYADNPQVFHCKADNRGLYEKTGSSYLWNSLINGQNITSLNFMGFIKDGSRIPLISDKENFHKFRDVEVNILYVDGHAAKDIQFVTDEK
ncbi:MAG: hypothetical protein RL693_1985 [Verrucomicrobiota bacterium]|jgi:prepilin-type N-terminal cleavage/methylation domain-containing protein/prepilin-type processing-associated H-X9-DG protein